MSHDPTLIFEPTQEQRDGYAAWVAERPPDVRAVAERFFPWHLYLMKSTGHRVFIASFDEMEGGAVTVRVAIRAEFNEFLTFERDVFGVQPDDLIPCAVPEMGPGFVEFPEGVVEANKEAILERIRKGRLA